MYVCWCGFVYIDNYNYLYSPALAVHACIHHMRSSCSCCVHVIEAEVGYALACPNQLLNTQVNKKFSELKGRNIGIVEKAQETRFGMSPKYSGYSYIGIAS